MQRGVWNPDRKILHVNDIVNNRRKKSRLTG
jgi:hypothetical protein